MNWSEVWKKISGIDGRYAIMPEELEFLFGYAVTVPENPVILELGVCHGRTFAMLGFIAQEKRGLVSGIDDFRLEGTPDEVCESLTNSGVFNFTLVVANTHTAIWDSLIDLLVVDAGHDEANVKPDIEKYVPFVKPGGIVFFHDYDLVPDPASAHWAVRHYADLACGAWEDLGRLNGLKGFRRPQ